MSREPNKWLYYLDFSRSENSAILPNSLLYRLLLGLPIGITAEFCTSAACCLLPFFTFKTNKQNLFCLVCMGPWCRSAQELHCNLICLSRVHYFSHMLTNGSLYYLIQCWLYPYCQWICLRQQPMIPVFAVWLTCTFMERVSMVCVREVKP